MSGNNETFSWKFYLWVVLVLGAVLGLAEAIAGGIARSAGLPGSPVVGGIGFAVMALGLAVFKQARVIPGVAVMAVLGKWLAVPLLGLPLLCQANAHLAVLLNGAFLYAGVLAFKKRIAVGGKAQGALAGLSAFGAGTAFFALGRFWAPCAHLLSFRHGDGALAYMLTRVVPAALLAAILFPLGYALGKKLEMRLLPLWLSRRPLFAPLASACVLACWGLTVWLTAARF